MNRTIDLSKKIRTIPDFPKQGILFRDITTLLKDPEAFRYVVDTLTERCRNKKIDVIVAIEARGFIIAAPVAYKIGAAFVPVRKKEKLPSHTVSASYDLEYGSETVEMHSDAIKPGQNVVIIDDLLATGGTAKAAAELVEKLKGKVVEIAFIIELNPLNGRKKLEGYNVYSMIGYDEA
ncbi:MAG: adenine phosphoribosyltransferase [Nitrososphaerales archaeon]